MKSKAERAAARTRKAHAQHEAALDEQYANRALAGTERIQKQVLKEVTRFGRSYGWKFELDRWASSPGTSARKAVSERIQRGLERQGRSASMGTTAHGWFVERRSGRRRVAVTASLHHDPNAGYGGESRVSGSLRAICPDCAADLGIGGAMNAAQAASVVERLASATFPSCGRQGC